ncbi:Predicted integral membrane protein [Achromobacter spanius]|uniref:DUF2269 family protein n=1 Tax=Achromobacter spanius TaxID=217203 RepID=UPI000C2BE79E|nr:DUF2269 domain-containing protein [Achromobacter spanius]AUA57035.1 DUF2269 domain-containing protein [Achromobacter spanius]CAB3694871.1 hypothetical protein LMG5911_04679 [Achromobacter spanius]SPT38636.1 Predicted integral membrane protein [Achromobacter denitrificans]VEE55308.1 Predicted integral membrane protein [Achromobacter spanius]
MDYFWFKLLHILSSTLLFGTGVGSAFYLLCVVRGRDPKVVAAVARLVVMADWLFTATTAVIQPLTGWYLVHLMQLPWSTPWLSASLILYAIAIACWLPVVRLQMLMRDSATASAQAGQPLSPRFMRYFSAWFVLGFPALGAFLGIFWLMVFKPA